MARFSTLVPPQGVWWTRLGRDERLWLWITAAWCIIMFVVMMFVWPVYGKQHAPNESYRVEPADFHSYTQAFIDQYQIGELGGVPVVQPPPGSDVYIEAARFQFRPVVQLKRGETYRLLVSSADVQHGLSIQPSDLNYQQPNNLNFQILPGYVMVINVTPQEAGDFPMICNEYCGMGHHLMSGRFIVTE